MLLQRSISWKNQGTKRPLFFQVLIVLKKESYSNMVSSCLNFLEIFTNFGNFCNARVLEYALDLQHVTAHYTSKIWLPLKSF